MPGLGFAWTQVCVTSRSRLLSMGSGLCAQASGDNPRGGTHPVLGSLPSEHWLGLLGDSGASMGPPHPIPPLWEFTCVRLSDLGSPPANSMFVKPTSQRSDFLSVVHSGWKPYYSSTVPIPASLASPGTCKPCSFSLLLWPWESGINLPNLHISPSHTEGTCCGKALRMS